jgi:hypothetical protein
MPEMWIPLLEMAFTTRLPSEPGAIIIVLARATTVHLREYSWKRIFSL